MTRIALVTIFIALFLVQSPAFAKEKSVMQLAEEYSRALRKHELQKTRSSLENLIRRGKVLDDRAYEVEALSDADYALFEKKMRGFFVNREEVLFVTPDLKFFQQLSRKRGTKADMAFFTVMRQIKPRNVWRAYYGWQTDVTGCTKYGNGVLTRLYGKAVQFKKAYPKAYVPDINEELKEILSEFTYETVCACGDGKGVEREFRLFIKTYPKDKNTPTVRKRLADLNTNKENRFYCQTG